MTVAIFNFDGTVVSEYECEDPHGIHVDSDDNMYICDKSNKSILAVNVGSGEDGLFHFARIPLPLSIAYQESDKSLFIGCEKGDNIFQCFIA